MTLRQGWERGAPWPTYRQDRHELVCTLTTALFNVDSAQEFAHRVTLGRMEVHEDEWAHIVQCEAREDWDWEGEETYMMHLYSQYWQTNSEVWKDLVTDILVALRGHPEDIRDGRIDAA